MATLFRLACIPGGIVDRQKREIIFRMQVEDGRLLEFVAVAEVAEQMASALAGFAKQIEPVKGQAINAQVVAQYGIQRDAFGSHVVLQLVTEGGVPHKFAIPLDAIADIVARLTIESEKDRTTGHA